MISQTDVEALIGSRINNLKTYQRAFTHKSSNEESYENLEFMGDSVLGFVVTKYLYDKYGSEHQEGFLTKARTKFVRGTTLASIAESLQLYKWIQMDEKGHRNGWNRNPKILEDVLEALIGAIYIDLGILHAKQFILGLIQDYPVDLSDDNFKDQLMRYCQTTYKTLPIYDIETFLSGVYIVTVSVNGSLLAKGEGTTKRRAEQDAASKALKDIKH